MKFPKLEILGYIYNRPSAEQTFREVVKNYQRYEEDRQPDETSARLKVEQVVATAFKEHDREKKHLEGNG